MGAGFGTKTCGNQAAPRCRLKRGALRPRFRAGFPAPSRLQRDKRPGRPYSTSRAFLLVEIDCQASRSAAKGLRSWGPPMKRLELAIESIILASRWLLVVFYLGLGIALAIYAVAFAKKLFEFSTVVTTLGETDTILKMLGLIDSALIASLVVIPFGPKLPVRCATVAVPV